MAMAGSSRPGHCRTAVQASQGFWRSGSAIGAFRRERRPRGVGLRQWSYRNCVRLALPLRTPLSDNGRTTGGEVLDAMGEVPLYLRIRDDLKRQIASGELAPGSKLPSSRQLAADLKVSRITVTNAYAELEADGLIESRVGAGTFVAAPWPAAPTPDAAAAPESPRWQAGLETGIHPVRDAVLRETARTEDGLITFGRARGDPRLFPSHLLRRFFSEVLADERSSALEYETGQGYGPL